MRALPILLLAVVLAVCATVTRYDAAGDIHALLVAIRDNDRQAFDQHVDRPALKAQIKTRLTGAAIQRGGALGGLLVAVVAPLVFDGYYELGIGLATLALLASLRVGELGRVPHYAALAALLGISACAAYDGLRDRRDVLVAERSFYGVLHVKEYYPGEEAHLRRLVHGTIMHGEQYMSEASRRQPTTYYQRTSGIGAAIESKQDHPLKVGVIGLGAGVIASWMKPGDALVFYEISPRVVDIARREFTFLEDSSGKIDIIMGDGRLSLEREPPRGYDVMGIDAFSGDSIPMHLITREAMALYVKHLKPDGVIVFQATNRFIDLLPVVKRLAAEFGMEAVNIADLADASEGPEYWYSSTDQVIVTRNRRLLAWPRIDEASDPIDERPGLPTFTDSHHNLLRILK